MNLNMPPFNETHRLLGYSRITCTNIRPSNQYIIHLNGYKHAVPVFTQAAVTTLSCRAMRSTPDGLCQQCTRERKSF